MTQLGKLCIYGLLYMTYTSVQWIPFSYIIFVKQLLRAPKQQPDHQHFDFVLTNRKVAFVIFATFNLCISRGGSNGISWSWLCRLQEHVEFVIFGAAQLCFWDCSSEVKSQGDGTQPFSESKKGGVANRNRPLAIFIRFNPRIFGDRSNISKRSRWRLVSIPNIFSHFRNRFTNYLG